MLKLFRSILHNLDKLLFVFSLVVLCVGYGMSAVTFELFPYPLSRQAVQALRTLYHNQDQYIQNKPAVLTETKFAQGGVLRYQPDKTQPGATLLTSFYGDTPGIQLVDLNGTVLHSWAISFQDLWPDPPHLEEVPDDLRIHIHGAVLEPNGDVVFNIEYKGLLKVDLEGRLIWRVPYLTHHSVHKDWKGNYWVCGQKYRTSFDPDIPMIERPFLEEFILQVSPDGQILQEISVYKLIYSNAFEGVLLGHGPSDVMLHGKDLMHLNDIEPLSPEMAAAFPLFKAGHVMVSLRNLNMVCVIDPKEQSIVWHQVGPFLRQHDPDFLANGRISIFDNRDDQANGTILGGSRIVHLDPQTGQVETVFAGRDTEPFFTGILGKHQYLDNGNLLITEGEKGRVFEVTAKGDIVWEYVNTYDSDHTAWVEQGHRYSYEYLQFLQQGAEQDAL